MESVYEEWRPVKECDDYMVSNLGRVKSMKRERTIERFRYGRHERQLVHYPETILKPRQTGEHLGVTIRAGLQSRSRYVHRLVAVAFLGGIPDGQEVNHIDGNKENNCASNLEYCTRSGNMKHAQRIGLWETRGERNPQSKLTNDATVELVRRRRAGERAATLAKEFGVSKAHVYLLAQGKSRKHITMQGVA